MSAGKSDYDVEAATWENLVACCLKCNNIKGDRTPAQGTRRPMTRILLTGAGGMLGRDRVATLFVSFTEVTSRRHDRDPLALALCGGNLQRAAGEPGPGHQER